MSSRNDPIRRLQRRMLLAWAIAIPLLMACGRWAWRPLSIDAATAVMPPLHESPSRTAAALPSSSFDRSVFAVSLWRLPEKTDQQSDHAQAQKELPPPSLKLIAIIDHGNTREAVLYDLAEARLHVVQSGERLARYTISQVTEQAVELLDGERRSWLRLREDAS